MRDNVRKRHLRYVLNCLRLSVGVPGQLWSPLPDCYDRERLIPHLPILDLLQGCTNLHIW
jgi:hypothetical protein